MKEKIYTRNEGFHFKKYDINRISEETGITETTLYKWRKDARAAGNAASGDGQGSEQWNNEDELLIVMETFTMTGATLAEYCRKKGTI